jgi:hypothetical protein
MADLVMDIEYGTGYGFVGLEDLARYRLDQIENGVGVGREAVQRTLDFVNNQNTVWRSNLSVDTTIAKELFEMPSGGTLQDIDEHGNPLPTVQLAAQDVAYPIRGGGDATGSDRVSRALMTFADLNRAVQQATFRDKKWHKNYILAAILRSTTYPFLDRTRRMYRGAGSLTVKPLANGDADTYIVNQGGGTATDNHYLGLTGVISSSNDPFPQIYDELVEHADADRDVVAYVAKDLAPVIELLPNFHERRDANIDYGTGVTTVPQGDKGIGDRYLGYIEGCHVVRMNDIPNGYIFAQLQGARPLAYREYPTPSLQGLFQETHSPDGNHLETRFLRYGGYGVRNRVAALVMQVNSATYNAPTSLPMKLS